MEELYRRYWKALVADAMRRLNDRQLSEDCAQETFLVLLERMADGLEFENEFKLVSFLYRTNHNIARHMLRARSSESDAAE
ncbi:MAG: sigma factor [Clostridia bacterium]|nr:sigma factor [Clostridia bacterium]